MNKHLLCPSTKSPKLGGKTLGLHVNLANVLVSVKSGNRTSQ